MAGITGLGTTYNLPNYTGILHLLSRAETPFFSAIGGLAAGGQTTETSCRGWCPAPAAASGPTLPTRS